MELLSRHSIQMYLSRHYTRLPPLHPAAATFHSDVHIRNSDAGWEKRAFQLLRTDVSGSSDSVSSAMAPFDSCPLGVLVDSCPVGAP
uniref:Uncharacterized protein n=1 Tax=Vitis vinifera TaxID=29760 RepID=A5CA31_VITVI|nr:hypothetical protein VITISV_008923 [Vitis vinifera]